MCIYAQRDCDTILFHHEGGVDIGDVDSKVSTANTCRYIRKMRSFLGSSVTNIVVICT